MAERRKAEIEVELGNGTWLDPRRGEIRLAEWAMEWVETRHDLRATTRARLRTTLARQVLPRFGTTPLNKISNAVVRSWVAEMLDAGLSPATARKAVFALRRCLAAAVADRRIPLNAAADVPLLSERAKVPLFLDQLRSSVLWSKCPTGTALWSSSAHMPGCVGVRQSA
jgi:site-specific recombinase XerC